MVPHVGYACERQTHFLLLGSITLRKPIIPVLCMLAVVALACKQSEVAVPSVPPAPVLTGSALADYQDELAQYWRDYEGRLRRVDGWLSLVGLHWLDEGDNGCGSDPERAVALPADRAPGTVGTFALNDGMVTFEPATGVNVTLDGESMTGPRKLATDADGTPSLLGLGSLEWFIIVRGDRHGVRVRDREKPALTSFGGIATFPVDPDWRQPARFETYDPPRVIPVPTVLGTTADMPAPGAFVFEREGVSHRLDAIDAGDELWLIFGDATNGPVTYGSGRFLHTPLPAADGTAVIDFNRAYNPPCAYSAFATCPLSPSQNKLTIAVQAGEKLPPAGLPH